VATYSVNKRAVAHARRLIDAHQYVLDSDRGEAQPEAADENAFLASHSWEAYSEWHLGLTEGASEDTKARYGFVYGDFRRVHRTGLIARQYRAAEWRHKEVELAAHDLLQHRNSKASRSSGSGILPIRRQRFPFVHPGTRSITLDRFAVVRSR
jgi:hypothetical protein